jgi:hypothetical protein
MNSCAGCNTTIDELHYMTCNKCNKFYDLLCAGLTADQYSSLSDEALKIWLCVSCRSMMPKTGNLSTPVRMLMSTSMSTSNLNDNTVSDNVYTYTNDDDNVTLRRGSEQRISQNSCKCACGNLAVLREMIKEELRAFFKDLSLMPKICNEVQTQTVAIKKIVGAQSTIIAKLNSACEAKIENDFEQLKSQLPSKPSGTKQKQSKTIQKVMSQLHPDDKGKGNSRSSTPLPSTKASQAPQNSSDNAPSTFIELENKHGKDNSKSEWTEVVRRGRARESLPGVLRGTAGPGATSLRAAERRSFLHLFYIQEGTTAEQVRAHLSKICNGDVCTVEELKARGNYASFKIAVPTKLVESVMCAGNWAEGICVRPWRHNFRGKRNNE